MPADATLAGVYSAWVDAGFWVTVYDDEWRVVAMSDDVAAVAGDEVVAGAFLFGQEYLDARFSGMAGVDGVEEDLGVASTDGRLAAFRPSWRSRGAPRKA